MMVLLLTPLRILLTVSPIFILLSSVEEVGRVSQEELLSKLSARLSADQSEVCEGALSVDECFSALKGMAHRKAPGNDGLPMEFYVKFWQVFRG